MSLQQTLQMIVCGGRVTRFHTHPTIKEETVAEHSYLVAWICALVWTRSHDNALPSAGLLLAALAHDAPEYILGDMPSPTKRRMNLRGAYRKEEARLFAEAGMPDFEHMLTDEEQEILKFADNLAGYYKCRYEQLMGNRLLDSVAANYHAYIVANIADADHLPAVVCTQLLALAKEEPSGDFA